MDQFRRATDSDFTVPTRGIWLSDVQIEQSAYTVVDGWVYFPRLSMIGPYKLYHLVELTGRHKPDQFLVPTDPTIVEDYELYESIREDIINRYEQGNPSHGQRIFAAFVLAKQAQERVAKVEKLL